MAKKRTIVDDSTFKFENPKDTFRGYLVEGLTDGAYTFEGENGGDFKITSFPQLEEALDFKINGVAVRDTEDLLIEIEYMGETTKNGKPYQAYRVSVE